MSALEKTVKKIHFSEKAGRKSIQVQVHLFKHLEISAKK